MGYRTVDKQQISTIQTARQESTFELKTAYLFSRYAVLSFIEDLSYQTDSGSFFPAPPETAL